MTRKCFHDQNQRHPISTSGNNCERRGRKPELPSKRWRKRNAEDFPSSSNHHQPSERPRTSLMLLQTWRSSSTCGSGGQRRSTRNLVNINQCDPIRSTSDSMAWSFPEHISLQMREEPGCLFHLLERLFATQLKGDLLTSQQGLKTITTMYKIQPYIWSKQRTNKARNSMWFLSRNGTAASLPSA